MDARQHKLSLACSFNAELINLALLPGTEIGSAFVTFVTFAI